MVLNMKYSALGWFSHLERMDESVMTKKAYKSSIASVGVRGWPFKKWEDRVLEYMRKGWSV